MFMHKSKKGFTIVELVIVIAVIAILAAVLIPTFSNLTKKANLSSDEQAVRQMNTALKTEFATAKPADLKAVIDALEKAGYNALTLKPHSKGYEFYWSGEDATVMLVKTDDKSVRYPADLQLNEAKAEVLANGAKFINVEVTSANIVEALTAGSDITLTENITLTQTVPVSGDTVINLNGYNLSGADNSSRPLEMTDGANLTIQGGDKVVDSGAFGMINVPASVTECSITLDGGKYKANTDEGAFIKLRPGAGDAVITLKDVTYTDDFEGNRGGFVLSTDGYAGNLDLVIEGGSFTSNAGFQVPGKTKFVGVNIVTNAYAFEISGEAEIIDCTITVKDATVGTAPAAAVAVSHGGTAKVSGCKINSDGDAYAVYSTGGTIIATNNTVLHAARQYFIYGSAPASITIDGKVVATK